MTFMKKIKEDGYITKEELRQFLLCLNPLAPHITSEIFERVFKRDLLDEKFPECDESKLVKDEIEMPVQVNGKFRATVLVPLNASKDNIVEIIKESNKVAIDFNSIKKVIFVPKKIINLIV